MGIIMESVNKIEGIIITIGQQGALGGPKQHTDTIEYQERVGANLLTRRMRFNERDRMKCLKKTVIQGNVVDFWMSNNVPEWSDKREWLRMSKKDRLHAYVSRFDEGYGVAFETL